LKNYGCKSRLSGELTAAYAVIIFFTSTIPLKGGLGYGISTMGTL
jgi:hypothetical protein